MTKKVILFLLLAFGTYIHSYAQNRIVSADKDQSSNTQHIRISLVNCSAGEKPWEIFGHNCLRVIDSSKNNGERDVLYNYGTLDFFDESFLYQFFTGKLTALLDTNNYEARFIQQYIGEKRGVEELVLQLNDEQKDSIISFLQRNILTENKYYRYDIFFDNCTTRIRDVLSKTLGKGLVFGQVIPPDSHLTFRAAYNQFIEHKYWIKLGMNIFFASRTDKIMTNTQAMCFPVYLKEGVSNATLNGQRLCGDSITILKDQIKPTLGINEPFFIILIVSLLTIVCLYVKRLRVAGKALSMLMLFTSGILGCVILYAWFASSHSGWRDNYNILWALPTNIIIPFFGPKIQAKYAIAAISLICLALLVDLLRIQVMPMFEIASFLIALICIYGNMRMKGKNTLLK